LTSLNIVKCDICQRKLLAALTEGWKKYQDPITGEIKHVCNECLWNLEFIFGEVKVLKLFEEESEDE